MNETNTSSSSSRYGVLSIILMFVPILTVVVIDEIIYPLIGKVPTNVERLSIVLFAVLPPLLGFIFSIVGLVRKEPRKWLLIIGLIFNLLQSLFFGFLAAFAG
jgi:hypothetical protein